jgi:FkbM family methyltransferase
MREVPTYNLLGLRAYEIRTIIDVGANVGQFAQFARANFPDARIVAFEPLPDAVAALDELARRDSNVEVVACALGEREEHSSIYLHRQHSPSSSLLKTTQHSHDLYPFTQSQAEISVPVRRLDSAVEALDRPLIPETLVKIDVQGYESHVIRGGAATIGAARACIVEVNRDSLYVGQANFEEIVALLAALGLVYSGNLSQVHAVDGHVIYFDALFVRKKS